MPPYFKDAPRMHKLSGVKRSFAGRLYNSIVEDYGLGEKEGQIYMIDMPAWGAIHWAQIHSDGKNGLQNYVGISRAYLDDESETGFEHGHRGGKIPHGHFINFYSISTDIDLIYDGSANSPTEFERAKISIKIPITKHNNRDERVGKICWGLSELHRQEEAARRASKPRSVGNLEISWFGELYNTFVHENTITWWDEKHFNRWPVIARFRRRKDNSSYGMMSVLGNHHSINFNCNVIDTYTMKDMHRMFEIHGRFMFKIYKKAKELRSEMGLKYTDYLYNGL